MLRQCPRRSVITVIWAILAAVGVPLWLCAAGILTLVARNRTLRKRPDNIPVRILRPGQKRWRPGHGIWVHDVFLFRGSPAAWSEAVLWARTRRHACRTTTNAAICAVSAMSRSWPR